MPYLMAVNRVRTSKAVFNDFSHFNIDYHRVPLSASRSLYENFADSVFCIVKETSLEAPLIFSCGMGLGRTSHSMILGMLTRRWMCLQKGFPDPFGSEEVKNCVIANPMIHSTLDADRRYLLQIIHLLQKGLDGIQPPEFSVEWAFKNSGSLGGLISAIKGEYHVIYQLLSVLLHPELKHIVDVAINRCSHLLNVREHILSSYIKYAASKDYKALVNASIFLQRYFSLICFGGFLTMENCKFQSFSTWFKSRNELWSMFQRIQKNSEDNCLFLPMDSLKSLVGNDLSGDLTSLDSTSLRDFVSDTETLAVINGRNGTVLGPNMILKLDHWLRKEKLNSGPQNGEILMFRKMNYFNASVHIYGMSQPTCEGILNLKEYIETADSENMVIWINLREEPVVYLNGEPYVLRDRYHTLRNTKSFKGIHVDQLEALENRLVTDIKLEALMFKNSLLVHEEEEGRIKPAWLQLKDLDLNILSVKQCIPSTIQYHRVPVTAEDSPEFSDFDEICSILMNAFQQWGSTSKFSVAVNCQVGTGRSSIGMIVCAMVLNCLLIINQESIQAPVDYDGAVPSSEFSYCTVFQKNEYSIIKALVRIVDNGTRAKLLTDRLIAAAGGEDLRETISKYRHLAEETLDKREQLRYVRKGLIYLKRYFLLVAFQAYLLRLEQELPSERSSLKAVSPALAIEGLTNEIHLSSHERLLAEHFDKPSFGITFETWMNGHPEFIHMMQNFFEDNPKISTIIPETVNLDLLLPDIGRKDSKGEMGRPAQAEVLRILSSQSGSALQVNAILKEDHFPGCQSSRLIDDIVKGGPNFRRLPIIFLENRGFDFSKLPVNSSNAEFSPSIVFATQKEEEIGYGLLGKKYIAGVAIPTLDAIESILWKMDATEECGTRQVVWTSLREEPVIYINRRPYVLRSIDSPYSNFEATGISRERVEDVEIRMKSDILAQAQKYNGRILLHGEMPLDGRFVLSPYMEDVSQSEILTPREYYERLVIEGFGIQYHRLPM